MTEPTPELSLVNLDSRRGYYRRSNGVWRAERRIQADRRAGRIVEDEVQKMRTLVRRRSDNEILEFLTEHSTDGLRDVQHVGLRAG